MFNNSSSHIIKQIFDSIQMKCLAMLDFIRNFLSCWFTYLSTCLNRNRIWNSIYITICHILYEVRSCEEYDIVLVEHLSFSPFKQKSDPNICPKQIQPFLFDKRIITIRLKVNRKEYLVRISQFSGCPIAIENPKRRPQQSAFALFVISFFTNVFYQMEKGRKKSKLLCVRPFSAIPIAGKHK